MDRIDSYGADAGDTAEIRSAAASNETVVMTQQQKNYSAAELAGLPGVPSTKRGVNMMAQRDGWIFRERAGRGGGREYPLSALPAITQAALAQQDLAAAPVVALPRVDQPLQGDRAEALAAMFEGRPASIKAKARECLAIVQEYYALLGRGFARSAVVDAIVLERGISEATLGRYLALVRGQPEHLWMFLLAPRHPGRTATAEMSAEAWELLRGDYLRAERPTQSACISRLRTMAASRPDWIIPSNRTLARKLDQLPRAMKILAREGTKALRDTFPAQQRSKAALSALSIVNGDGYRHNVWVRFPDGEVVRAKTWFFQDVYSSKVLAWRTDKTEHTDMVRLAFGDLVERWGIPGAVLLDNTLAAANKTMSGGIKHRFRFKVRDEEPDGVFKLLGLDVMWATPGHGQAKPVERVFGKGGLGEYVDKAPELAGAWTGGAVDDKPEYDGKSRVVDLADLSAVIEREISAYNAREGRRGAIQRGRSFDAVFDESYRVTPIQRATEAQRRLWLLATEPVNCARKDGAITLDAGRVVGERLSNRFWSARLHEYAGRKVVARFDPHRLHEGVHVYTTDGRYIDFAICDMPAGFNDRNAARERSRARNTFVRSVKAQREAEQRMGVLDVAKARAGTSQGTIPAAVAPTRTVIRGAFGDPLERPPVTVAPMDDETAEMMRQMEAEQAAGPKEPAPVDVSTLHNDDQKYAHWKRLQARVNAGESLTDGDADFFRSFGEDMYCKVLEEGEAIAVGEKR